MSDFVYIITENIHYEDTWIRGVFRTEADARAKVAEIRDTHRYQGGWEMFENDDPHILTIKNKDVAFVVKRHRIEEENED